MALLAVIDPSDFIVGRFSGLLYAVDDRPVCVRSGLLKLHCLGNEVGARIRRRFQVEFPSSSDIGGHGSTADKECGRNPCGLSHYAPLESRIRGGRENGDGESGCLTGTIETVRRDVNAKPKPDSEIENGLHHFPMQPAHFPDSLFSIPCLYLTTLWNNCDCRRLLKSASEAAKWTASLPELELTSVPERAAFSVSDPLILR